MQRGQRITCLGFRCPDYIQLFDVLYDSKIYSLERPTSILPLLTVNTRVHVQFFVSVWYLFRYA